MRNAEEVTRAVVDRALAAGATAAEAILRTGTDFSTTVRLGSLERLLQAGFTRLGIRVFCGGRSAVAASSDLSAAARDELVSESVRMARCAGEDPFAGLPPAEEYAGSLPALKLSFPAASQLPAGEKVRLARRCEEASLAFDPRVRNSEGAVFSDKIVTTTYVNSHGYAGCYEKTTCSLSVSPLAESGTEKQRDTWLSTHPDVSRLQAPEQIGAEAARRAVRRLGARKVPTCAVPVVFDPSAAAAVLKHVAEAVSGTALVRRASFLADRLGRRVAADRVTLIDDALLPEGIGSRHFDAEGVPSRTTFVIREGFLESFLLDCYSARKLGLRSTGNSNREPHGSPSVGPSNFFLRPGPLAPDDIVRSVDKGLYVTELIGFGVNVVSGDFSQGAAGLWIEGGALAYPVEEITVAGNLRDILLGVGAVANDLTVLGEVFAPTILVDSMMVSGN